MMISNGIFRDTLFLSKNYIISQDDLIVSIDPEIKKIKFHYNDEE